MIVKKRLILRKEIFEMNNDNQFQNDTFGMPPVDLGFSPKRDGNNMAVASLILAIASVALLFFGCICINLIPAILAIVFAAISAKRDGKMSAIAIVGLVIGILCVILNIVIIGFAIYIGMELINHPDGSLAMRAEQALDEYFRQHYGTGFREYMEQMYGDSALQ